MILLGDAKAEFCAMDGKLFRKSTGLETGCSRKDKYRVGSYKNRKFLTHRILYMLYHNLEYKDLPKAIDHIDGDVTNNLQENLRGCHSNRQNLFNCKPQKGTSKYKGVSKNPHSWVASIMSERKTYYLGSFKTEEEAAMAYNKAAEKFFGQYAKLNDIEEIV